MPLKQKLAPHFIALTQDACLKAFWRKEALQIFLRQHKISESHLASLASETKRAYLARMFKALLDRKDTVGHALILDMARSLAEIKHFPDLENWEDSKDKIAAAQESVARLRTEVDKLNRNVREEKEARDRRQRAAEERQRQVASQQTLQSLTNKLTALIPKQGTQAGGYAFEEWFFKLVAYAEMTAHPPSYKDLNGRQIDGSVTLDGTTYLVEAKFTAEATGSQDIDIFLSKIARKADNTMGIMVSMAGFNENAIKNASRDRTPLLLMDYSHIFNVILPGIMTLPEVIQRIGRHASQTGESYLSVTDFSG